MAVFFVFLAPRNRFLAAAPDCVPCGASFRNHLKIRVVARRAALHFVASLTSRPSEIDGRKSTVKWVNPPQGYGFIQPSTGDKGIFGHISAVERAGLSSLNEGQTVEYELVSNRGKSSAEKLKVA